MIRRYYIVSALWSTLVALLLFCVTDIFTACSGEDDSEPAGAAGVEADVDSELSIEISASSMPYDVTRTTTRSWTPPTSYFLYDDLYDGIANYQSLSNKTIDVFFTKGTEDDPLHGRLRYVPSTSKWKLALPKEIDPATVAGGDYYVYGFIPRDAADNAIIAKLPGSSTFADGAVLTLQGVPSVVNDACVVIGAKEGPDEDHDNGLRRGDFCLKLKTGKDGEGNLTDNNYLYLLFDHLCAALCIRMRVDGDYHALRHIKLKELSLMTGTDEGLMDKKTDVVITLHQNNDGSDPISSIEYIPSTEDTSGGTMFQSDDGHLLTPTYQSFLSHFIPDGITQLVLTSVYDVYDNNATASHPEGNLVRKNCMVTNTISLKDIIDQFSMTRRGYIYTIDINIKPTYLYMLSEPDFNSPDVVVE